MRFRLVFLLLLSLTIAAGCGVYSGKIAVSEEWNPWAPLSIEEPLNWLTAFKLSRVSNDDELCMATLAQAKMRYAAVPDRETDAGCGFRNAVRIEATSASVGEAFTLSCRSAVALAMWEYHSVQPAARVHFGSPVKRLEHFGSYACRNIYGLKDAALSRHATADALDVAGFVLGNGRRIRVERDWQSEGPEGRFLREVRDGACRLFDSVLGPDYNAAHRNHFHLDRGGYQVCQ